MTRLLVIAAAFVMVLSLAVPAFGAPASDGAGQEFGQHHATHAQEMGGFSADMNPGGMHQGFSGWEM